MSRKIAKSTGVHEPFNKEKIKKSLQKAGASENLAQELLQKIEKLPKIKSTKDLYTYILKYLHEKNRVAAARYNLKYALMELGPAGFPFERFIAEIFKHQDYKVKIREIIKGYCVKHEVDFMATKNNERIIAECKFHNRRGLKSDLKVALYVKARFDDIKNQYQKNQNEKIQKALIVTNTKFTSEAIKYGECVGIDLIDWSYPYGKSLPSIVNNLGLHPITALTSLNKKQKVEFIKHGLVLCKQTEEHKDILKNLGLTDHQIKKIIKESNDVCKLQT